MRFTVLISALFFAVAGAPGAETNEVMRSLTLQECIELALKNNLDIQIQRYTPIISREQLHGAYGAYDPTFEFRAQQSFNSSPGGFNPNINLEAPPRETYVESFSAGLTGLTPIGLTYDLGADLVRSSGTAAFATSNGFVVINRGFEYNANAGINLRQPLLRDFWIDATRLAIAVNRKNLKISENVLLWQIMNTVLNVEEAYYDLIFAIESVRVQTKALELADRLLADNKKRVEVGNMAKLDEKQAESQAAISAADLLSAQRGLDAQQNLLKNLITDNYLTWHAVDIQPSEPLTQTPALFNLEESWQHGMTYRPDLQQVRIELERRDIVVKYTKNQLFPMLDLIGSYGRNGLDANFMPSLDDIRVGDNPRWSYGAILTIPLSNRDARSRHKISKAEKQQALLRLKSLEQNILVQIDDAVKLAQSDFKRVDATRNARLYAESALEAEQKKLESGKSTSFFVLSLQRDLTTARSAEIRALADYKKALARLSLAEGHILERNRVELQSR